MFKFKSVDYVKLRKKTAKLFIGVLSKKISIRNALGNFPKDCEDKTIITAWHALCHLEADEDIRQSDPLYKKEQDEYIEYIAEVLQNGEELPENIINSYTPYHQTSLIANTNKIKGIIQSFKKFLC